MVGLILSCKDLTIFTRRAKLSIPSRLAGTMYKGPKGPYTWSRLAGMDFLPRSASMKETPRIFLILYMGSFKTSRPAEMLRESPGTPRVTRIHDEASRILVISHPTEMKLSHPCHVNGYPEIILTSQTPLPAYLNSEGCFYCQDIAGVPKL